MFEQTDDKYSVRRLAMIFNNTTATYKFYWFVALLDILVKERKTSAAPDEDTNFNDVIFLCIACKIFY